MKNTTTKSPTMTIYRNWRISSTISKANGTVIEVLEDGPHILYRSCKGGLCRYSDDLWMAEIYCEHLAGNTTTDRP
jgi:hypothetical protein